MGWNNPYKYILGYNPRQTQLFSAIYRASNPMYKWIRAHYLGDIDMLVPWRGRSRLVGKSLQQTECLSYEAGRPAWQASTLLN